MNNFQKLNHSAAAQGAWAISSGNIHLLPETDFKKIKILGADNPRTLAINVKKELVEAALQDLLSGDADLTVEYLKDCSVPATEMAARGLAARFYLNSGNGPREIFNVSELSNFLNAHVQERKEIFENLNNETSNSEKIIRQTLLTVLTGFSSLSSWQQIVSAVGENKLIVHHNASLASCLVYLGNKGVLPKFDQPVNFTQTKNSLKAITKDSLLIFDPMLKEVLLSDDLLRKACIRNNVKVLVPVGLHRGITAYGTDSENIPEQLEKFTEQLRKSFDISNTLAEKRKTTEISRKAENFLYERTIEDFEKQTGLKCEPLYATTPAVIDTSRLFTDQISTAAFEPEIVRKCLEQSPGYQDPELRHVLNSLLISQLHIYEQDRFRGLLQVVDDFFSVQKQLGKDLYIVLPEDWKSFGFVSSIYAQFFGFPSEKIITIDSMDQHKRNKDALFVVLDDLAATGGSLFDAHKEFKKINPLGEVCYFPLICTEEVVNRFAALLEAEDKYSFCSVQCINSLKNTSFWKSLDGTTKERLVSDLGRLGYGHMGLAVVLPHSIPNNDLELLEPGMPLANLLSFARQDSSRQLRTE